MICNYKQRLCKHCKESFTPASGKQRWCKVCCPDITSTRRLQRYGISKKDWNTMFVEQDGKCKLCDRAPTRVDHDHVTSIVRGLLCNRCNIALACVEKCDWIEKALRYVER